MSKVNIKFPFSLKNHKIIKWVLGRHQRLIQWIFVFSVLTVFFHTKYSFFIICVVPKIKAFSWSLIIFLKVAIPAIWQFFAAGSILQFARLFLNNSDYPPFVSIALISWPFRPLPLNPRNQYHNFPISFRSKDLSCNLENDWFLCLP